MSGDGRQRTTQHLVISPEGASVREVPESVGVRDHPGYFGVFTRAEVPGCWPNGTRVRKHAEDPGGDLTPLGSLGTVLGSMLHPTRGAGYFIEWDRSPRCAVFAGAWKLARA